MLKTENIQYKIGKKQILKNISAVFYPGRVTVILGPNGSGKSSFLKIACGETNDFTGHVFYDNRSSKNFQKSELAKTRAVMSQQTELNFPLLVSEVVMMGRYPHFAFNPGSRDISICEEIMGRMDLQPFKDRNYLTLSGGEKQRVQFARVLAQIWEAPTTGNRYLFLDEPITSLDIHYQHQFLQTTKMLAAENIVVIAVLHDINLAMQYGDDIVFMKDGGIVKKGAPADVITADLIHDVFNIPVKIVAFDGAEKPVVVYHHTR